MRGIDVAALLERDMIGEQLEWDIQQQGIELGRGRRHLESRLYRDRQLARMRDRDHRPATRPDLLDRRQVLREQVIARKHHDGRRVRRDQRQRPVLQFRGGIRLGMEVTDLLEL